MNRICIIGNMVKDPELFTTTNGVSVCNFTIAISRKYANAQGERETDFINCIAWRTTAEFVHKYFKKGQKMACVGSIQTRTYEANDKTKRYVTEVVVDEVEFVEKASSSNSKNADEKLDPIDDDPDILPF